MPGFSNDIDIILEILRKSVAAHPGSVFLNSLLSQYQERGSLSKKQLEGLYAKAHKIAGISPGKLATLQAIILRKPNRYRSNVTISKPEAEKDDTDTRRMIDEILEKFPQHKRVLFFRMKLDKHEGLQAAEMVELKKFHKLLMPFKL